jgi:hypothetical protein
MARKELAPARAREPEDVLDVGQRGGYGADDSRVERPATHAEQEHGGCAARGLEPARGDVLVRHAVAQEVRDGPEGERPGARAGQRTRERSRGDVEGDDHRWEGGGVGETNVKREES